MIKDIVKLMMQHMKNDETQKWLSCEVKSYFHKVICLKKVCEIQF
jgi:hypothetical protein